MVTKHVLCSWYTFCASKNISRSHSKPRKDFLRTKTFSSDNARKLADPTWLPAPKKNSVCQVLSLHWVVSKTPQRAVLKCSLVRDHISEKTRFTIARLPFCSQHMPYEHRSCLSLMLLVIGFEDSSCNYPECVSHP